MSDAELLDRWRGGDAAAGEQLFAQHFDSLYRFFLNKADDAVDDLIQATFLAAVAARDEFRGDASFRSYLFAIARNELYAHWKKRAKRDEQEDISELSVEDLGTRPSGVLARHREQQLLLRALRSIPLELQIAIELHYWEELSGSEMAIALGVPEGTARSRLRRGLERLEEALERLAEDPATLASSLGDLERWASSLRAVLVALVVACLVACGGEPAPAADAMPAPPDRLLPGPCTVVSTDGTAPDSTATYTYDEHDRLVGVDQPTAVADYVYETGAITTYTRDDAGAIVSIRTDTPPDELEYSWTTWTFTDTSVAYASRYSDFSRTEAEYEVGLRFLGDPLELGAATSPSAPDHPLHAINTDIDLGESTEVTYTYDGPPRVGTRTQTASAGAIPVRTFTYDDDGNLLEIVQGAFTITYRWESGRLAEVTSGAYHSVYHRDQFGNLLDVDMVGDDVHVVTTYSYGCW